MAAQSRRHMRVKYSKKVPMFIETYGEICFLEEVITRGDNNRNSMDQRSYTRVSPFTLMSVLYHRPS